MISILVLGGLGVGAGSFSNEESYKSETIFFSTPVINEKEEYVSIDLAEATSDSWETDKPVLPLITKVYTFEIGTRVNNVEVTFSDIKEQKLTKLVEPAPELQILSLISTSKEVENTENIISYSDINIYPEIRWGYKTGAGLKNRERVIYLTVYLYPLQYNPRENVIYYSDEAKIDITYTLPKNPVTFQDEYDYLIIAPKEFATALQPLVDHKETLGIKTKLTTLDQIPSVGADEQESIKYYIKDAYDNWGITYLLLVGAGVKDQELFPVRNAWIPSPPHEDYFPSDLYYADIYDGDMVFSNWDKDGDGRYAEYPSDMSNVDVYPDVYIGRLCCNNVREVKNVVNKIINYKAHNKMTKKILQAGGDTFPDDAENINEGEYANEKVMEKLPGYTTTQLWGSNEQLTKGNIAKGFKSNVDFADFSGHGSYASWATHAPNEDKIWIPDKTFFSPYTGWLFVDFDLFFVNNGKKLPVVVYNACSNNKFSESNQCLGWKTLSKRNGGGIASFAASGIGFGAHGTGETERVMGWMEVHVFEELFNTKELGQSWGNCISGYYDNFVGSLNMNDYKTMLEFCMFGDPTLVIEDGDDPVNIPFSRSGFNIFEALLNQFPRLALLFEQILEKLQ